MKNNTFNSLQFRMLTLVFILFSSSVVGYRYFIELPKLDKSLSLLANKELSSLTLSLNNILKVISNTTYDYAVWTSTYNFMRDRNADYLAENIIEDTFKSLEFDGIFYINENFNVVVSKGVNHLSGEPLEFEFYNFKKFPNNLSILPRPITTHGTPETVGFIQTKYGPAIYCANQIRTSNLEGENRGFLVTIKLINEKLIESMSFSSLTKITLSPLDQTRNYRKLPSWDEKVILENVRPNTEIVIRDMNNVPIFSLKVQHSVGSIPALIDYQTSLFIILFSVLACIMYKLISNNVIAPVKRLANEIKQIGDKNTNRNLKENYPIIELNMVAKNINKLINTIEKQNALLVIQANTDQLTKVLNRHGLEKALDEYKNQCILHKISFCIVMCDVDHFKKYNDILGHLQGDSALYQIAQNLSEQCKRKQDVCARYGGEEFTMLFYNMTISDVNNKLQKILNSFAALNIAHPGSPTANYITVSLGAVVIQHDDISGFDLPLDEVMNYADKALYESKSLGRNRFTVNSYASLKPQ